jgi:hypothetical protein
MESGWQKALLAGRQPFSFADIVRSPPSVAQTVIVNKPRQSNLLIGCADFQGYNS